MYLIPSPEYLFNDIDEQALNALLLKIENKDDEFCKNMAEEFFKQRNIDMAIYSICYASLKNPKRIKIYHMYSKAYLVHKIATKVNNWYAVLGIKDLTAEVEKIEEDYYSLASFLKDCPSVAAESALRLINAGWQVLSHPEQREAYDKQLFSASSEFHEYVALSSACTSAP